MLKFSVADTGEGIAEDKLNRLFERFSQVDSSINRRFGGSGLGLAICKSLVEMMGGAIDVTSVEGLGSTFLFSVRAHPAEPIIDEVPAFAQLAALDRPGRILVVDDNDENRDLVKLLLGFVGHAVEEAASGAEAVASAMDAPFDLILMDIQMPGVDGLAASCMIRESAELNTATPILAFTANVIPQQLTRCLDAGMSDHISKPIRTEELMSKVSYWLNQSNNEESQREPIALFNQ